MRRREREFDARVDALEESVPRSLRTLSGSVARAIFVLSGSVDSRFNSIPSTEALSGTINARFVDLSGTIDSAIKSLSGTINARFASGGSGDTSALSGTINARFVYTEGLITAQSGTIDARIKHVSSSFAIFKQDSSSNLNYLSLMDNSVGLVEQTSSAGITSFVKRAIGVGAATSIPTRADADGRFQPLDAELTAIAALSTVGLIERTGAGTAAIRTIGVGGSTQIPTTGDGDSRWGDTGTAMLFGTGIDGDVTLSAGTSSLARVMHYNNLTIPNGATLDPSRFPFFVAGTLTIDAGGAIRQNGGDAPGGNSSTAGTAGGAGAAGTLLGVGGAGQNGFAANGAQATALANLPSGLTTNQLRGSIGGNGHTGVTATTAVQPATSAPTPSQGSAYTLDFSRIGLFSHTTTPINGGSGGGGGAGDNQGLAGSNGAGGGGGGGVIAFGARTVINNGSIEAKGGLGGNKTSATGAGRGTGGGAGGNGGRVIYYYHSWTGSAPDVSAGTGGSGAGAGTAGANGTAGQLIAWRV